jgi:hypothetical protein
VAFPQVTEPQAVWAAIDEYDRLGAHAFHEKYGFGPADEYFVPARGRLYDSKAILAAAQAYEHPNLGPARNEFSGGAEVQRRLSRLGFTMRRDRRCGDFLKLLPGLRVGGKDSSIRVSKPLLLLVRSSGRSSASLDSSRSVFTRRLSSPCLNGSHRITAAELCRTRGGGCRGIGCGRSCRRSETEFDLPVIGRQLSPPLWWSCVLNWAASRRDFLKL